VTITVVVIGRAGQSLKGAIDEFEGRATRYWKLRVVQLPSGTGGKGKGEAGRVLKQEEEAILKKVPDGAEVVALTRGGSLMSSPEFSEYLQNLALRSVQNVVFVVGGAFGLGAGVIKRANRALALSAGTLPHELARLVLAEQLYRAGTIARNEPYHKGTK
jgi:23S rRNA (pseudouridine1915-N3)-methyltransferase